jgi:hypothetical protein
MLQVVVVGTGKAHHSTGDLQAVTTLFWGMCDDNCARVCARAAPKYRTMC